MRQELNKAGGVIPVEQSSTTPPVEPTGQGFCAPVEGVGENLDGIREGY
jgi:hypothetical protein